MNQNDPPVMCRPVIAPILDEYLTVESFDKHIELSTLIVNYIKVGVQKDNLTYLKRYDKPNDNPNYKTVLLPLETYDFIIKKSHDTKISTGIYFLNYLILGMKQEKGHLPNKLRKWFDGLENV